MSNTTKGSNTSTASGAAGGYAAALEGILRCWRCGGDGDDDGGRCHVCCGRGGPNVNVLQGRTVAEAIEDAKAAA